MKRRMTRDEIIEFDKYLITRSYEQLVQIYRENKAQPVKSRKRTHMITGEMSKRFYENRRVNGYTPPPTPWDDRTNEVKK